MLYTTPRDKLSMTFCFFESFPTLPSPPSNKKKKRERKKVLKGQTMNYSMLKIQISALCISLVFSLCSL